ncbi:MAG: tetratricopeptide repeat protein [Alphaproteobacteria bacterium]
MKHVFLSVTVVALAACQPMAMGPMPVQPSVLREALPVSGTALVEEGFGEAVSGYMRGVTADMAGDNGPAAQGYLTALMDDTENANLKSRVFELALVEGDMATAVRLARTMPARTGDTMPVLVRVVGALHEGNMALAQTELQAVSKVAPDLLQISLINAYLNVAQGGSVAKHVAAVEALKGPQPQEARKQYHIARMWMYVPDEGKAVQALEASNALEPGSLFTTLMLADMYHKRGATSQAVALYNVFRTKNAYVALLEDEAARIAQGYTVVETTPNVKHDVALTLFDFGLLVWSQGAVVPARQLLAQALYLDPTNPYMLYYAGIVDESARAYAAAMAKYSQIPENSPVALAARIRQAEATFRSGQQAEGVAMAKQLVAKRPDVQGFQRSLAEMAFDSRDYSTALKAYDTLLKSQSNATPPAMLAAMYFARGATYERLGQTEQAGQDLSLSLILNPVNPSVLNYLAYMWVDKGIHLNEATAMLERAHEAAPEDGAIMDSLGWAYYQQGQYDKALPLLEQGADATPDDATVFLHLGDVHAKLRNMVSAQRYWRQGSMLLKPEDDAAVRKALQNRVK